MLHRLKFPLSLVAFREDYFKSLGLNVVSAPSLGEGEVGSWHCNAVFVRERHINRVAMSIHSDLVNGEGNIYRYDKKDLLSLIAAHPKDFVGENGKDAIKSRKRSFQLVFDSLRDDPRYREILLSFDQKGAEYK